MSNVKAAAKRTAKTINKIDKISRGRVMIAAAEAGGDTALSCGLPDGSLAFILSDGMGKGAKAADESRMVTFRLKELLKNGTAPSRAIKTVNRYMLELNGGREDFATVDLTVIDKQTGVAKFYKMGAATSFIIRCGKIKRIQQPALPVGIIPSLSATCISVRLKAGDTVIMLSDGVTEADRQDLGALWLEEFLLKGVVGMGPKTMAEAIASAACRKYGNRETDDLTVVVAMIK